MFKKFLYKGCFLLTGITFIGETAHFIKMMNKEKEIARKSKNISDEFEEIQCKDIEKADDFIEKESMKLAKERIKNERTIRSGRSKLDKLDKACVALIITALAIEAISRKDKE